MQDKSNEELLALITQAAAELERRRQANGLPATTDEGEEDEGEGGDHPPDPKFP